MSKVPVQKGTMISNPMTLKQMTHREKVAEAEKEHAMRKDGQTLRMETPSSGRKKK